MSESPVSMPPGHDGAVTYSLHSTGHSPLFSIFLCYFQRVDTALSTISSSVLKTTMWRYPTTRVSAYRVIQKIEHLTGRERNWDMKVGWWMKIFNACATMKRIHLLISQAIIYRWGIWYSHNPVCSSIPLVSHTNQPQTFIVPSPLRSSSYRRKNDIKELRVSLV